MSAKVRTRALEAGATHSDADRLERLASNVWICRGSTRSFVLWSVGYRIDVAEITSSAGLSGFEIPADPGKDDELDALATSLGAGNKTSGQRRALALVQLLTGRGMIKP